MFKFPMHTDTASTMEILDDIGVVCTAWFYECLTLS